MKDIYLAIERREKAMRRFVDAPDLIREYCCNCRNTIAMHTERN